MRFDRAMRWLLRADQPVPTRSNEEISAEVERNFRWNFVVNLLDGSTFVFGASFISSTTIVPLFISKLTDSPFIVGLVAVIAQASWFLPQLFTANAVERLARKKPVVVNLGFFSERVPLWIMIGAAFIATRSATLALILFLITYAWHGLGAGVIATAWQDMLARCFPVERRGRFFGTTMFLGGGVSAGAAGFSAWILEKYPFPTNFVYVFTIAAASISVSWVFVALTREPVQPVTVPAKTNRQFWADLPQIIKRDHNFRHFLVGRILMALGGMGAGFVTVSAVQRWAIPDSTVGLYTVSYLIGQTIGNLSFGFLADRFGHKLSLEFASLASLCSFSLAWLAPSAEWYFLVFALLGVNFGGTLVSGMMVVLEFAVPERRPTYSGLSNTGAGVAGVIAPLIGAWLASHKYEWLFALGAVVNLAAFAVLRWWVREPRYVNSESNLSCY